MHQVNLPDWAIERGRALNDFPAVPAGRTVLVNIDMQNVFVAEGEVFASAHARDIVPAVNRLAAATRARGWPVIWTRTTHAREGPCASPDWQYDSNDPTIGAGIAALQAGAAGHELYPLMDVAEGDLVIDKYRYGAFACPAGHLARALKGLDAEMIIITGTSTNCCCETTAREANMVGYKVIVVSDATAALTDAEHNAALLNLRVNFADVRRAGAVLGMIAAA
ncbi:MAG TPA: cysteine hydrolase [Caulobacteraceae bacterium]|jgi:nicotinamidase-related amidase